MVKESYIDLHWALTGKQSSNVSTTKLAVSYSLFAYLSYFLPFLLFYFSDMIDGELRTVSKQELHESITVCLDVIPFQLHEFITVCLDVIPFLLHESMTVCLDAIPFL